MFKRWILILGLRLFLNVYSNFFFYTNIALNIILDIVVLVSLKFYKNIDIKTVKKYFDCYNSL